MREQVVWSDETKMEIQRGMCGAKETPYVRWNMVRAAWWGYHSSAGWDGNLVRVERKMDGHEFCTILQNLFQSVINLRLGRRFLLQHDSDHKHKWCWNGSKRERWMLGKAESKPWESLALFGNETVQRWSPTKLEDLYKFCQEEWGRISLVLCAE